MKNKIKIVSVLIGTMIGAGFASGKEIFLFFSSYGRIGLLGILLSIFLTSFVIYRVFLLAYTNNIQEYSSFLDCLFDTKFSFWKRLTSSIIYLFLLISFFIMVSGFGAYFYQEFTTSPILGIVIILALCYLTFHRKVDGMTKINTLLIPLLILLVFVLGIQSLSLLTEETLLSNLQVNNSGNWILDAVLYSSYNSILLIPIILSLTPLLKDRKDVFSVSALTRNLFTIPFFDDFYYFASN